MYYLGSKLNSALPDRCFKDLESKAAACLANAALYFYFFCFQAKNVYFVTGVNPWDGNSALFYSILSSIGNYYFD